MHGGREPGDFDYLWAGKKGTTMIKGAIFDMDGTLVDNTPVHIRAFEIFCERYGIRDWKEKLGQAYGMGNDDIMRLIMPAEVIREKGLAALAEEKESIYREIYAPEIVPMPGLTDLLQRLRNAGIRCAVGSSGCRANVDFVLEKCDIESFFDAKINGDMVTRCKPDPEIYLLAAEGLHLLPADCLVFEDARAGITAARRAGAGRIVALVTTDTRSEHGEIRSHGVPDRIGRQRQTGHDQILREYGIDRSRSLQRLYGPDQGDRSDRCRNHRRKHVRRMYSAGIPHPAVEC